MYKLLVLGMLALTLSSLGLAQTPAPKAAAPKDAPKAPSKLTPDQEALLQVEQDWNAALAKGDAAALERILAPDFISTDESGKMLTKDQAIAALKSGKVKYVSLELSEQNVRVFGDVGVVTALNRVITGSKDKPVKSKIRFTDVFVKRGGRWQAVAAQDTTVSVP